MNLGIIGTGEVGRSIARRAHAAGYAVTIGSRRDAAERDALAATLPGIAVEDVVTAAARDMVVLAVPWRQVAAALEGLPAWNGRLLIDATNPFLRTDPPELEDLGGQSASVLVAAHVPDARVVKAFNSLPMAIFDKGPQEADARRVLFMSGDDADAKVQVTALIEAMGYAAIDLGGLQAGGLIQQAGGPLAGKDILLR